MFRGEDKLLRQLPFETKPQGSAVAMEVSGTDLQRGAEAEGFGTGKGPRAGPF